MSTSEIIDALKPKAIVQELDKYIIGQERAKKSVAIALRNRWRRQNIHDDIRDEVMPNNIIMIGPTGVGKTEIARRLAHLAGAPFIKVEASKFTEVGYVGRDVEAMIRDITDLAVNMVQDEMTIKVRARAEELVEKRLLSILLPAPPAPAKDALPATVEKAKKRWERSREKMLKKLRDGKLDARDIELDVPDESMPRVEIFSPGGNMEELGMSIQEMFGDMMPKKKKKRTMPLMEARKVLMNEETHKLLEMDKVVSEAVERVEQSGIIFIDEIDKIAGRESKNGPDVSREGVQRDLLPVVEGCTVSTKYGMVKTDHILFIAAGAFHYAKPSDLIPEMQGRFPIRVELDSLTADDFVRILTEPKNALLKQYEALLKTENVSLTFPKATVAEIAAIAFNVNEKMENIGARRLHTILTVLLDDILFNAPDTKKKILITVTLVRKMLKDVVKDEDLSRYIL